jgi:hypothetical protein
VNDNPKNKTEGEKMYNSFAELNLFCSVGKSREKHRNAAGVSPDVAKPILPQKRIEALSWEE